MFWNRLQRRGARNRLSARGRPGITAHPPRSSAPEFPLKLLPGESLESASRSASVDLLWTQGLCPTRGQIQSIVFQWDTNQSLRAATSVSPVESPVLIPSAEWP